MTGDTPDVSEWVEFEFYDLVWYWYQIEGRPKLCICNGVSHRAVSRIFYWNMIAKGDILSRTTVQNLIEDEVEN